MFKRDKGLACLVIVLALSVTSLSSAHEHTQTPLEQMSQDFVVAFNTGDNDTMAGVLSVGGGQTTWPDRRVAKRFLARRTRWSAPLGTQRSRERRRIDFNWQRKGTTLCGNSSSLASRKSQ